MAGSMHDDAFLLLGFSAGVMVPVVIVLVVVVLLLLLLLLLLKDARRQGWPRTPGTPGDLTPGGNEVLRTNTKKGGCETKHTAGSAKAHCMPRVYVQQPKLTNTMNSGREGEEGEGVLAGRPQ